MTYLQGYAYWVGELWPAFAVSIAVPLGAAVAVSLLKSIIDMFT